MVFQNLYNQISGTLLYKIFLLAATPPFHDWRLKNLGSGQVNVIYLSVYITYGNPVNQMFFSIISIFSLIKTTKLEM